MIWARDISSAYPDEGLRLPYHRDAATAQKVPDLRQTIAFRNVLIHGYATVDPARVWRVIVDSLPPVRAALAALLAAARVRPAAAARPARYSSGRPARRRPAMKSSATSDAYGEVIGR